MTATGASKSGQNAYERSPRQPRLIVLTELAIRASVSFATALQPGLELYGWYQSDESGRLCAAKAHRKGLNR